MQDETDAGADHAMSISVAMDAYDGELLAMMYE